MENRKGVLTKVILIFVFLISLMILCGAEVDYAPVEVSVNVLGPPAVVIYSPIAGTYLTGESLSLDYLIIGADIIKYNLDGGSDITITQPITFDTTSGIHTLYLFADNQYGSRTEEVIFTVDSNVFTILNNDYSGILKGESTNFLSYTYQEMQTLDSVVLQNTDYGKILFTDQINLVEDENPGDDSLDLDTYTDISSNRIEVNSSALPNFNKPATLWFYGLTFSDPRILKDGVFCPEPACVEEDYTDGILRFSVTDFSVYTAEETPGSGEEGSGETNGEGSGGGDGDSGETIVDDDEEPVVGCQPWICSNWTNCRNEKKIRTCINDKDCDVVLEKPTEVTGCECTEEWICNDWTGKECGERVCNDVNDCGTEYSRPDEKKFCFPWLEGELFGIPKIWAYSIAGGLLLGIIIAVLVIAFVIQRKKEKKSWKGKRK
jgi:hypothetical protein